MIRSRMRMLALAGAWCLAALIVAPPAMAGKGDRIQPAAATAEQGSVTEAIRRILTVDDRLPGHLERVRQALTHYYVTENGAPYWLVGRRMTDFIQRIEFAEDDGLKPEDYHADYLLSLRDSLTGNSDPVALAYAELTFSTFFHHYASDLKTGRFVPQKIDPDLFQPKRHLPAETVFSGYRSAPDPMAYLDSFQPRLRHYGELKKLLHRYRRIANNGGWPQISSGKMLRPGDNDPRLPQIRARLIQSGDLDEQAASEAAHYDPATARAMQRYQRRHGINDQGIIGKLTLIRLNVSARERVRQIIVNMERWRWMPQDMGARHIMVNIAGFELERVRGGKPVEHVPVMVGKTYHQTPVFSDKIEYVEFNPTWTVPYSIATKEMLPKLKSNPGYLSRNFELLQGRRAMPFSGVDFSRYDRTNFPYTIRQKPGMKNALGQVKFMLPNKHHIYLHDTPAKALFSRHERAFSHGCVRVYKPLRLAVNILSDLGGYDRTHIDRIVATGETTRIDLPRPIPIHLVYATVWLSPEGEINFRADIYGRDRKLYNALFAKKTS